MVSCSSQSAPPLAGLAAAFAYVTQFCYGAAYDAYRLSFDHPFTHEESSAKPWRWVGIAFHVLAVITVAASYGALISGAVLIYRSLP